MIVNPYEPPQLEQTQTELAQPQPADDGRLRAKHAFLYLFGVAIAAALDSSIRGAIQSFNFPLAWWPVLVTVAVDGVGIASLLWLGWQRVSRSPSFPRSFGHWLLLIQGTNIIANALFLFFYDRLIPPAVADDTWEVSPAVDFQVRAANACLWTAAAVVPFLAVRYNRQQSLWVRYGVVVLVTMLFSVLSYSVGWESGELRTTIFTALGFIGLLCLIVAAVRDFNHPQQFDQLHWVGVVSQLVLILWIRFCQTYWASLAQQ
jgi:hypothetical protein